MSSVVRVRARITDRRSCARERGVGFMERVDVDGPTSPAVRHAHSRSHVSPTGARGLNSGCFSMLRVPCRNSRRQSTR